MSATALEVSRRPLWPITALSRVGYPLLFFSGFAGLGYELVWVAMLGTGLGHEVAAVLAVVAAFFVGLSLGGLLLGPTIHRAKNPWIWYLGLELVIAGWALALVVLTPHYNTVIPQLIGITLTPVAHGVIGFSTVLFLLLPATVAMGGTLPAIERVFSDRNAYGRVSGLYAANTLGAVVGVLVVTYWMVPAMGFAATLWVCAAVNLGCALAAWLCFRTSPVASPVMIDSQPPHVGGSETATTRRLLITLFCTGFLGLGYEVVVVRVLSQVLEDTVYTFAGVLCVYLLGTAVGAMWQQHRRKEPGNRWTLGHYLTLLATLALSGATTLWFVGSIFDALTTQMGSGSFNGMLIDVAVAAVVLAAPTFAMGALFGYLSQELRERMNLGTVVAVNTLGSAIAPLLCGVVLLPLLGAKWLVIALATGYLVLLPGVSRRSFVPAALAFALCFAPPLRHVDIPQSWTLLDYDEGVMASVAVVEDPTGTRHLKVNNHFTMGSTSSTFADHRQTHLPLLLHPKPRNALILGVGTGMSLSAAQYHPDLHVSAVELLPEALQKLNWFDTSPAQNDWDVEPELFASDARRFVLSSKSDYDVIVADLFHPSRDGAGSLFSVEHFSAIRNRLNDEGLFMQWLPLFQMDLETFELIAASFVEAFGAADVYLPHFSLQQPVVGLMGSKQSREYSAGYLQQRVLHTPLQRALVQVRMNSDMELFGGYLGRYTKTDFDLDRLNTDNWPQITYSAPEFAYRRTVGHGERLVALANKLQTRRSASQFRESGNGSLSDRLPDYWAARDLYLTVGLGVSPDASPEELFDQTATPLLEVVAQSAEFQSAYMPLLAMARSMAAAEPARASQLLKSMINAAPSRQEAREMLRQLNKRRNNSP